MGKGMRDLVTKLGAEYEQDVEHSPKALFFTSLLSEPTWQELKV